jgi:hypothetical protein
LRIFIIYLLRKIYFLFAVKCELLKLNPFSF